MQQYTPLKTSKNIMAQFKNGKLLLVIVVVLRCANGGIEYWVNGEIVIITLYMINMTVLLKVQLVMTEILDQLKSHSKHSLESEI